MAFLHSHTPPALTVSKLAHRARFDTHFAQIDRHRLTVIQAPAGYGKTSLLLQWYKQLKDLNHHSLWLSVVNVETSAIEFLSNIASSLQSELKLGARTRNTKNSELFESRDSLISHITLAMAKRTTPLFFCIDDFHLLGAAPQAALSQLIELAPSTVRFLITSRNAPTLHLGRIRARGELQEILVEELKFGRNEIHLLIEQSSDLNQQDITLLDEKTEGWAAGIKLLEISARYDKKSLQEWLKDFTGYKRSIADFFGEEVLNNQREEIQHFLILTSFLEYFDAEQCAAITEIENSGKLLAEIDASGLFVQCIDDERGLYRYHHLFADFLKRQLQDHHSDKIPTLYQRAWKYYLKAGDYDKAIEYALRGGDPLNALELLEQRCQDMTYTGKFRLVNKFVAQIPHKLLKCYPRVQLTLAWLATRNLRFDETRQLLDNVSAILDQQPNCSYSHEEQQKLRYLLLHREMVLAAAHDQHEQVEILCNTLLNDYPNENHPYLRGTIYGHLMDSRREQFKLNDIEHLQSMAHGILLRSRYTFASIALQASIGPSLSFIGKSVSAKVALEQGLEEGIRFGGLNSSLSALPALPLAEILYQENELQRAEDLVAATLPFVMEFGFTDQLRAGFLTRARVCAAKLDFDGTAKALKEGISIATERKLERLRIALLTEQIKLSIQIGNIEQAKRDALDSALLLSTDKSTPHSRATTLDELRAQCNVRIKLLDGELNEAMHISKLWRRHTMAAGAIQSRVTWDLLILQILFISGDERAAQRTLRDAMTAAVHTRQFRQFIDEGPIVHTILSKNNRNENVLDNPIDAFAMQLLRIFEGTNNLPPNTIPHHRNSINGSITAREKEILILISSGLRNSEVAQRLGMTEGSIKWYMQQIYDKVGTRRRMQAVDRARQLGLIA